MPVGLRSRLFEGDGRVGDVQGSKDAHHSWHDGPHAKRIQHEST